MAVLLAALALAGGLRGIVTRGPIGAIGALVVNARLVAHWRIEKRCARTDLG